MLAKSEINIYFHSFIEISNSIVFSHIFSVHSYDMFLTYFYVTNTFEKLLCENLIRLALFMY